jgi:hypothetical protein
MGKNILNTNRALVWHTHGSYTNEGTGTWGWYLDMAQEGNPAPVFDSIPMFQPQSYAIKGWTTENTDRGYQNRDH